MSHLGQKAKYSLRADVFRFAPESGRRATWSACPFRANFGSRPDLLDAKVAGFSKCDSRNTMHGPLKGVLTKDLESAAMVRERDDWGYYVRAIRDLTHPPSWRWRIIRRGNPMGVLLEAGGFSTYEAARFAGKVALADFLEQLEREKLRDD
jgi:hypothetical protein